MPAVNRDDSLKYNCAIVLKSDFASSVIGKGVNWIVVRAKIYQRYWTLASVYVNPNLNNGELEEATEDLN